MKPTSLKSVLKFSRLQRSGLFILLTLVIAFQIIYYCFDFTKKEPSGIIEKTQWLSLQAPIDSIKKVQKEYAPKTYPYNPNFITDFKGYKLGMSVAEIDRLLAFRKTNRYVNSAKEFQAVTQVSDSLLNAMATSFKFPNWVVNSTNKKPYQIKDFDKKRKIILDINTASAEDLKKVYGIGDGLSERILKEKQKLGGFVSMEQMKDIWGLSPEVVESLNKDFTIGEIPEITKININNATVKELSQFPYFRYVLAKSIVTYRSMNGGIKSSEDLIKISGFPVDKIKIIVLYLEF